MVGKAERQIVCLFSGASTCLLEKAKVSTAGFRGKSLSVSKKSLLLKFADTLNALWHLDFFYVIEQFLVLLHLQKDPYNNFEELERLFKNNRIQPLYFFLLLKLLFMTEGYPPTTMDLETSSKIFQTLMRCLY